ncbi:MAG: YdcF family protein [Clostridia bacterium]|nr:YdcF family protein [Clostridia bacterium]
MKLSAISQQDVDSLTLEQVADIVFGIENSEPETSDFALLLGCRPGFCEVRALQAAKIYRDGKVGYVMPSGGAEWQIQDRGVMTEAAYMSEILKENGVPEEAILLENEARSTKENLIYGTLQMNRRLKIQNVKSVCIVTEAYHMRRSLGLAKLFLPRSLKINYSIANYPSDPIAYMLADKMNEQRARKDVYHMIGLINAGLIDDIEF